VFECQIPGTHDRLAVKLVDNGITDEVQILRSFSHPHIVRIIRVLNELPLVVALEFCAGGTLESLLRAPRLASARSKLGIYQRVRAAMEPASALEFLHERRVVHRNITSANIFFTAPVIIESSGFAVPPVVLGGFGSACVLPANVHDAEPLPPAHRGPLPYLAPEVLRGDRSGFAADVYSCGMLLYEVCSGRLPYFDLDMPDRVLAAKVMEGLRPSRDYMPAGSLGEILAQIVAGSWDQQASLRMSSYDVSGHLSAILS
jgi:serine/threonine protein kinase